MMVRYSVLKKVRKRNVKFRRSGTLSGLVGEMAVVERLSE